LIVKNILKFLINETQGKNMSFYVINKIIEKIQKEYSEELSLKGFIEIDSKLIEIFNQQIVKSGIPIEEMNEKLNQQLMEKFKLKKVNIKKNAETKRIIILQLIL